MPTLSEVRLSGALTALTIGGDAATSLRDPVGINTVVASFVDATYVSDGRRMIVVTSRRVSCGPIHVVVDANDVRVEMGARVMCRPDRLELGHLQVALGNADVWTGKLPGSQALVAASDEVINALAPVARRSEITAALYARHLDAALAALRQRDFDGVARSIVGLGPGLTPAGDDVLAGILIVAVALGALVPGDWTPSAEVVERTNPLSLSFVRLAATGQAIGPVHDLLVAGAKRQGRVLDEAVDTLFGVGATSGADIAFGMSAGLHHLVS